MLLHQKNKATHILTQLKIKKDKYLPTIRFSHDDGKIFHCAVDIAEPAAVELEENG